MRWLLILTIGSCLPLLAEPRTNSVGITLVSVPAGSFEMGSPPTEKSRRDDENIVSVSFDTAYFIAQTEVTQKQWRDVMGTSFSDLVDKQEGPLGRGANLSNKVSGLGDDMPMCFVNWSDALAFCKTLTKKEQDAGLIPKEMIYSLPTEAQWEYSCRAGTKTVFGFGDTLTSKDANFYGKLPYGVSEEGEYRKKMTQVKTFQPNPWKLYDMHGNLYEWCLDWYGESLPGGLNPKGPERGDGRIIRGGAWDRKATSCRSAYRYSRDPVRRAHNIGFRIVLIKK